MQARDYQKQAIQDLRQCVGEGFKSPLLVMPTGSGKTLVSSLMIQAAIGKGKHVLFLAPRRELVNQTSDKLDILGVDHGVMMSGENMRFMPHVQVASIHTLYRRCFKDGEPVSASAFGGMTLPKADLIVVDEAHTSMGQMAKRILAAYPNAVKIGMTATPARSDGRGLGEVYDKLVEGPSVKWLTENGYLVPARYFGAPKADLSQVKIQGGDYQEKGLSEAMNQPKLVGDVVENWLRICPDRQTVVFAVDRAHAMAIHKQFASVGIKSEYLDGNTPNDERRQILSDLEAGDIQVVCSVDVLSYGWDCPVASCGIIARPTKSIARYLQVAGRILRPCEGKQDAILIDHGGIVEELGFVDDDQPWSLDGKETIQERKESKERKEPDPIECHSCHETIKPSRQCSNCGADLSGEYARALEVLEADLKEIERKEKNKENREYTQEEKAAWFGQLKKHVYDKGQKPGRAVHLYKEKFGVLPWPVYDTPMQEVGPQVYGFIQHQNIRRAKSKQKSQTA